MKKELGVLPLTLPKSETIPAVAAPARASADRRASIAQSVFDRLDAIVVLAGATRPGALRKASGRSRLELPIDPNHTVLDCWGEALDDLAATWSAEHVPVRIIVDRECTIARGRHARDAMDLHIEEDPSEFRGPGGLLRDLAGAYDSDRYILVIRASHLPIDQLSDQVERLAWSQADLSILCSAEGQPHGMTLIRCGCLDAISPVGYVDFNEQGLPAIAANHDVRAVRYTGRFTESLRTYSGYLSALGDYHRLRRGEPAVRSPFAEQLTPSFAVIEPGAQVSNAALIHDSVILRGARVERDATVVRSVVCPHTTVRRGRQAVDQIVGPAVREHPQV